MRSIQSIESTLDRKQEVLRWCGLLLLVVQHSTLVLTIPFTRAAPKTHRYDPRVAVLMVELIKFVVCAVVVVCRRKLRPMMGGDVFRSDAYRMSVPALCYVVQHNLLYVALTNLPAVTSMVLVQTKLLWAALFSVLLLGRRFAALDWCAFVALIVGVVLVQFPSAADSPTGAPDGDDAVEAGLTLADFSVPAEPLPVVGVLAACAAAALSGFAGVFLEHMFTQPRRSLFVGNIQLCLYSIPLQLLAVGRALYVETPLHLMSRHEVAAHLFAGFHASVWAVVALQAAGGLIVGMVLKFAGNLPKFFAAATALVLTSLLSVAAFGLNVDGSFWLGVLAVAAATALYEGRRAVGCARDRGFRRVVDMEPGLEPGSPTVEASEPYWGKPLVEDLPRHDGTFVPSPRLEAVERRISH